MKTRKQNVVKNVLTVAILAIILGVIGSSPAMAKESAKKEMQKTVSENKKTVSAKKKVKKGKKTKKEKSKDWRSYKKATAKIAKKEIKRVVELLKEIGFTGQRVSFRSDDLKDMEEIAMRLYDCEIDDYDKNFYGKESLCSFSIDIGDYRKKFSREGSVEIIIKKGKLAEYLYDTRHTRSKDFKKDKYTIPAYYIENDERCQKKGIKTFEELAESLQKVYDFEPSY